MVHLAFLASGILFGLGLVVSGLANPAKVLAFLDITGAWDPSLALTMAGAVATTALGYRLVLARPKPVLEDCFHVPAAKTIDRPLLGGAALFGVGWGLVGYCPGPAVTALAYGETGTFVFFASMLAGMWAGRMLTAKPTTPKLSPA